MKTKVPVLTPAMVKRVRRADYTVGRHGACLICGNSWDDCPHNINQVYAIIEAVKMGEMLGMIQ